MIPVGPANRIRGCSLVWPASVPTAAATGKYTLNWAQIHRDVGLVGMLTGAIGATPSLFLNNVRVGQVASVRRLALRDWKRPSVEELTVPREAWSKVDRRNQRKFNLQLAIGVIFGGYTAFTLFHNVLFNGTPSPLDKRRHTKELPEKIRSSLAEMQESGVAKTYLDLNQIKDAPISLKLVAEENKRAKDASSKTD